MISNPVVPALEGEARLRVVRYFSEFTPCLETLELHQERADKVRELEAKSDDELFQMGLLRDEIVEFVCRDALYV